MIVYILGKFELKYLLVLFYNSFYIVIDGGIYGDTDFY